MQYRVIYKYKQYISLMFVYVQQQSFNVQSGDTWCFFVSIVILVH